MAIENVEAMTCVRCGATAMVDGSLMETSGGGNVHFLINAKSYFKRLLSMDNRKVKAYACLHCSHVELMVEFTEKDRKQYQEFDGPQPGVLDRIS